MIRKVFAVAYVHSSIISRKFDLRRKYYHRVIKHGILNGQFMQCWAGGAINRLIAVSDYCHL